jgi:glycosyltransferase involved in cell wall biosynthesis
MHLLVVSHSCATPINQQIYAELERQTGWKMTLVVPDAWKDEFGNILSKEKWPEFSGDLISIPVWKSGNIILHVYKENWGAFLDAGRFDAIYVNHEPYALATAHLCWANSRTLKAPFGFYSCQNILKKYPPPFSWSEGTVFRKSSFAFPITDAVEEVLIAKGFRGISTVCALPLDPGIYRPRGLEEDLKLIPRANDETIIGYVGRLVEAKGLRTLVDSLGSLQDLSWRLVVIGTGEFEATFRRLLTEGGIINRVVFSGYVPHAETPRYLSAFDVLVVPSETQPNWKEQFGRVITEAMSCGTPVIGSSSGEIPNLIRKSNGGLIFPEKNAAEFAKCLRQMITQKDLRQKLGENGRKWVESEVSLSAVAKKMATTLEMATILEQVAGSEKRRA